MMVVARARTRGVAVAGVFVVAIGWSLSTPNAAYAAPPGCTAGAAADFNGDGRADAAVGDPNATVSGQVGAGRVVLLYGDADGRVGEGSRGVVAQGLDLVGGIADAGDRFGSALAAADLNCDGYTDLVVGSPLEDINGQADSGYVQLIWGSSAGLGAAKDSVNLTQTNFGRPIGAGDNFGWAVDALEDVGQGGTGAPTAYALAIGAPGADVGADNAAGFVGIRAPLDGGLVYTVLTQDTAGIPGEAEPNDRFGTSVALNFLLGSAGVVDVAVGAPYEDKGSIVDAGNVTIITDISGTADGGVIYDQDSPGVANAPETGDRFGFSLDSIRTGSTTRLAVGVPYEDVGAVGSAGLVQLFGGNGSGLSAGPGLTQNTAGVLDSAETGDLFGEKVAYVPSVAGDPVVRLAVATPGEDGVATNTGLVQVFPLNDIDAETSYSQSTPGVPGDAQSGDKFGSALAVVTGPTERVLLVGAPDDVEFSSGMVNVIPIGGGGQRTWVPGSGGIPTGGASQFGGGLAGAGNPNG